MSHLIRYDILVVFIIHSVQISDSAVSMFSIFVSFVHGIMDWTNVKTGDLDLD